MHTAQRQSAEPGEGKGGHRKDRAEGLALAGLISLSRVLSLAAAHSHWYGLLSPCAEVVTPGCCSSVVHCFFFRKRSCAFLSHADCRIEFVLAWPSISLCSKYCSLDLSFDELKRTPGVPVMEAYIISCSLVLRISRAKNDMPATDITRKKFYKTTKWGLKWFHMLEFISSKAIQRK